MILVVNFVCLCDGLLIIPTVITNQMVHLTNQMVHLRKRRGLVDHSL